MTFLIGEMLFCLLAAFFLGLLLGWVLWFSANRRLQADLDVARSDTERCRDAKAKLEDRIAGAAEESGRLARVVELATEQATERKAQLSGLRSELDAKEAARSDADEGLRACETDLAAARSDLEACREDLAREREELRACLAAAGEAAPAALQGRVDLPAAPEPPEAAVGSVARGSDRDDLREIYGIGRVLEDWLHGFGILTFRQIALWNEGDIDRMDELLKHFTGRIRRDVWPEQARRLHLAKYDEEL